MTKCNHLVPRADQNKKCDSSDPDSRTHYWIPTGRIQAMLNEIISVDFCCKYCNRRTTNFLSKDEYQLNKKFLEE
jgi:hypothetical protein